MAKDSASNVTRPDGSLDFSQGVDSHLVTTLQSEFNPNGLPRNQLAWLVNGTVRNGGISPRSGWQPLGTMLNNPVFFQGGYLYAPLVGYPYLMFVMGGHLYMVNDVDHPSVIDLSVLFNLYLPANIEQVFFCQAEQFLVIQAGDFVTLPLFWDGATLVQSRGIKGANYTPSGGSTPYNQLPPSGPMCYYMGRLWYAQTGRKITAGDIVGNQSSGTLAYGYTDSVLSVTENPLAVGGDGFTVPSEAGNIRALAYAANLNTQLGQGVLYIFTREQIYALQVPIARNDWMGANTNNMPLMFCVQVSTGSTGDRCVVQVNSDLFFQTFQPSVQSLQAAIRNFSQWGSVPVSVNEQRVVAQNNRALLWAASGIYFDNRLLQTAAPQMTPYGVTHPLLVPLNFDSISSLNASLPPAWEGALSGLDFLQLFEGDFGGLSRALGLVISRADQSLQLWELTFAGRRDNGDNRIEWIVEFPAFTWGKEMELKELVCLELWLDDIEGTVEFVLDYRPDSDSCWYPWHSWKVCAARNSNETPNPATPYPTQYGPGYKSTITLPHPPQQCNAMTGRPAFIGYQFQPRLTIKGWCRIRGVILHASNRMNELYGGKVC